MEDMFTMLKVSASALEAQKVRLNVIASNIANVNSTRTPEGGPYRRKDVVFESYMFRENAVGVDVPKIVEDERPFERFMTHLTLMQIKRDMSATLMSIQLRRWSIL